MQLMRNIFDFLLLPLQLLGLPVLTVLGLVGVRFSIFSVSNGRILALRDRYLLKQKIVFFPSGSNTSRRELGLGDYSIFIEARSEATTFSVSHSKPYSSALLQELRSGKGLTKAHLSLPDYLSKLDKEFGSDLYSHVISGRGEFPCFIRSDLEAWENLSEAYFEYLLEGSDGVDEFVEDNKAKFLDSPADMRSFGTEDKLAHDYLTVMTEKQSVHSQIQYQLLRYTNIAGSWGSLHVAEKLGDWVYMLSVEARFYLHSLVHSLESINQQDTATTLEFHIRNVFYSLMQSADAELHARVLKPFKDKVSELGSQSGDSSIDQEAEEFHKYITGRYPPTLAGAARFFDYVRKSRHQSTDVVVGQFIGFVSDSDYLELEDLINKRFIQKLFQIGRLRGSIMHPSKISFDECAPVLDYLLEENLPGDFFYALGVNRV